MNKVEKFFEESYDMNDPNAYTYHDNDSRRNPKERMETLVVNAINNFKDAFASYNRFIDEDVKAIYDIQLSETQKQDLFQAVTFAAKLWNKGKELPEGFAQQMAIRLLRSE